MRRLKENVKWNGQANVDMFISAMFNRNYDLAMESFLIYLSRELGEKETDNLVNNWIEKTHNGS